MADKIYVALLDEDVDVWRPAPARQLDADTYQILKPDGYDPASEHWEFPPGSTVICEPRRSADGTAFLAAVRLKQDVRRTA